MDPKEYVKGMIQEVAETAASYTMGQSLLKQVDRALWTVEKSAIWAVPPALDDDNSSQPPELVRPLPWILFLALLVVLRVTRESISLVNLVLGKPPLRAADVVAYIQSKRRYIRAIKYQGSRKMRSRTNNTGGSISGATMQLLASLQSLLGATMCFKRSNNHGDKQTDEKDQILIVKRKKGGAKGRESGYASPAQDDNTMEKLIEKMVDMYRDSDDDSDYTLTNVASTKSNTSTSDEDSIRDANLDIEPASSTPNKPDIPVPMNTPKDCSDIREESLLDSSSEVYKTPSSNVASSDLINSERKTEHDSSKKSTHNIANGQTYKASSSNNKKDTAQRQDSEVPPSKVTPAEGQNTNGTEEK